MILQLTAIPKMWNGAPIGLDDREGGDNQPRDLRSFVIQSLCEAQLGQLLPNGNRQTEPPETLLKRFRLSTKIEQADGDIEVDTEEFQLIEQCLSAHWKEVASTMLIGALHDSVGSKETEKTETADG